MRALLIGLIAMGSLSAFADSAIYICNGEKLAFSSSDTSVHHFKLPGNKRVKLNQNGRELIFTGESISKNATTNAVGEKEFEVTQILSVTSDTRTAIVDVSLPFENG